MLLKRSLIFTTKREKYNYMSAAKELAKKVRIHALKMAHRGGAAHTGSSFSIADILAVLYTDILKKNSQDPNDDQRDRFVLSKGPVSYTHLRAHETLR